MEEPNVLEFMYVTCFFLFFFCFFVFLFLYSFVCRAILVKAKTDYLSAASHCTNVNFLFFFIIYLFLLFYCHLFLHFIIIFILFLILLLLSLLLKYLSGLYSKPRFCFFPERESIPPPAHAKHRGHKVVLGEPRRKHSVLPPLQPCQYRVLGRGKY